MFVPKPFGPTLVRLAKTQLRPYTTPVHVQIVVTRRCNLACGYCNEYDHVSAPVPLEDLERRIDRIAELGTLVLTLTGGEPLMHPKAHDVIAHATSRGMVCTSITNGTCLTKGRIEKLNDARLSLLQISVDNLEPDDVSQKSWSMIKPKLELVRDHGAFDVNVNAVLGSCRPEETRKLVSEIREMGFYMTIQMLHDDNGQLDAGLVGEGLSGFYEEIAGRLRKSVWHRFGEGWERAMLRDGKAPWKCRAGSRYLYVDEAGIVSYCSQRRGEPGISILEYGREDLRREFFRRKGCEDGCTIGCVRRASASDEWRPYGENDFAATQGRESRRDARVQESMQPAIPRNVARTRVG